MRSARAPTSRAALGRRQTGSRTLWQRARSPTSRASPNLEMLFGRKAEGGLLPPFALHPIVLGGFSDRHRRVRKVWDHQKDTLELLLDSLEPRFLVLDLLRNRAHLTAELIDRFWILRDLLLHLLVRFVSSMAQRFQRDVQRPALLDQLLKRREVQLAAAGAQALEHRLKILGDVTKVEHLAPCNRTSRRGQGVTGECYSCWRS